MGCAVVGDTVVGATESLGDPLGDSEADAAGDDDGDTLGDVLGHMLGEDVVGDELCSQMQLVHASTWS